MVPRRRQAAELAENSRRPRLHGHQAERLRHLGERCSATSTACSRRPATSTPTSRCSSRRVFLDQGSRARRGLRQGVRRRHALPPARPRRQGPSSPTAKLEEPLIIRPTSETIIWTHVRTVDPELPRPAAAHQPVVQRRALGDAHPAVPAHRRVPLAGRPHRPRHRSRSRRRDAAHARRLRRLRRGLDGDAR